jgi:hypothetical protein
MKSYGYLRVQRGDAEYKHFMSKFYVEYYAKAYSIPISNSFFPYGMALDLIYGLKARHGAGGHGAVQRLLSQVSPQLSANPGIFQGISTRGNMVGGHELIGTLYLIGAEVKSVAELAWALHQVERIRTEIRWQHQLNETAN